MLPSPFKFIKKIILILLITSLIWDFPISLNTFFDDVTRPETEEDTDAGYPWVDSDLPENITVMTKTDPADDFHIYACKDLILEKKYIDGYVIWTSTLGASDVVDNNAMKILKDEDIPGHDAELVRDLYGLFTDWEARDENGFSDLKELTDPILEADDLDELTDYFLTDDAILMICNFFSIYSGPGITDSGRYAVYVEPEALLLDDPAEYSDMTELGSMTKDYNEELFIYYAGRLGITESRARDMLDEAFELESRLAESMLSSSEKMSDSYIDKSDNEMSFEEISQLTHNYPLADLIKASDLEFDGTYIVSEPDYVSCIDELYTEENLEGIRSIAYINALLDYGTYCDREACEKEDDISNESYGTDYWYDDEDTAYNSVRSILSEPLQKIYVEEYGSEEDKKRVEQICRDVIENYDEMLSENTWATEETIDSAREKLTTMDIRVGYPDQWNDYSDLSIEGCTLFEAVKKIYAYKKKICDAGFSKGTYSNECWAFDTDVLECNAYYNASENRIYITLAAITDPLYNSNMSIEEQYASLAGFWIGHEISHSFDSNGSRYDAEGDLRDWWNEDDMTEFRRRIDKLDDYLDEIVPFGDYHVTGSNVDTEMLADITGLQCALRMASSVEDFDYDVFFTEYAKLNAFISDYSTELTALQQDEHPLSYLRTNVVVQQFDEFYDTYDIEEGDNMYLAPEDRLLVW